MHSIGGYRFLQVMEALQIRLKRDDAPLRTEVSGGQSRVVPDIGSNVQEDHFAATDTQEESRFGRLINAKGERPGDDGIVGVQNEHSTVTLQPGRGQVP